MQNTGPWSRVSSRAVELPAPQCVLKAPWLRLAMQEPELDIPAVRRARESWKDTLAREHPLILPAAHDALTAKLIKRAGFPAYQVGGLELPKWAEIEKRFA